MENGYKVKPIFFLKFLLLGALGFLLMVQPLAAQVIVPFTQRSSIVTPDRKIYNIRGDFTMIGNTNLTLEDYGDQTNNSFNQMKYVDVDQDPRTLNSSSATLQLSTENGAIPECSNIIYAGLYWSGRSVPGNEPFTVTKAFPGNENPIAVTLDKKKLKIKGPRETSYTEFQASNDNLYFPDANQHGDMFVGYVEITEYVQKHGLGEYTVADLAIKEDLSDEAGYFGGWSMVIIYENSQMKWRDITSFDGFAFVDMNVVEDFELPVSGFKAIQHGPVAVKLGIMVGEGDVDDYGDFLEIRNKENTDWISLSHEQNSEDNFFNSSIFTGGTPRNPSLKNNTGVDISMFAIPNENNSIIGNGQTSTSFHYGSAIDTYVIYNLTFAVDAYVPGIEPSNKILRINQQAVGEAPYSIKPGEEIEYELDIRNTGTEGIENGKIVIPIPSMVTFVNSHTTFNQTGTSGAEAYFDPNLGSSGSIVWNIGTVPLPDEDHPGALFAQLKYTLKTIDDCLLLSAKEIEEAIVINGKVNGVGMTSETAISDQGFVFGFNASGICIGEPILVPTQVAFDKAGFMSEHCVTPPTAEDDLTASEDGATVSIHILTNDKGGSFQIVVPKTKLIDPLTNAEVNTVTIAGEGVYTLDSNGNASFTPVPGFNGISKVLYKIYDEQGLSAQATLTVTSVYKPPITEKDQGESAGEEIRIDLLANDRDGSGIIDPRSVKLIDPTTGAELDILTILGKGTIRVTSDGVVVFTPEKGFEGVVEFEYTLKDINGVVSNRSIVSITVALISEPPIKVPNTFTPNGDGRNDTFVILNTEGHTLDLSVFNRWGNEVYKNRNYKNDWSGRNLNEGTYYYQVILKKDGKEEVRKGWILLKR